MTRYYPRPLVAPPPSTAARPYPGRTPHWVKPNHTERIPHRHIVADCESRTAQAIDGEVQTLRCAAAVRWRRDLPTGDHRETARFTDAVAFWRWVRDYCHTHGRTVVWFHNAAVDLAWTDAFRILPALGYELAWCNLDRQVSVVTWRSQHGTLVIADTYTWIHCGLAEAAPFTSTRKPPLPRDTDSAEAWMARCEADVLITEEIVRRLLAFIAREHLGNWQPSGAGMGWTTWRHRFMDYKVLIHDDTDALEAEREAMHAGRAESWHHGPAPGGPFTLWDMSMCYTTIAAECLIPAKLWCHDPAPTARIHAWALEKWRTLARVTVTTDVPVVPAQHGGRVIWPVGTFQTTLWDTELELLTEAGGTYTVQEQWRYTRKPALKSWADWSITMCRLDEPVIDPIARLWVKHQARATIGRMGLRTASWEPFGANWMPYTGISYLTDAATGQTSRLMHVGAQVFAETGKSEAQQSCPQIISWIMAEARSRLWRAALAAGINQVVHVDTDSLITTAEGSRRMEQATALGLPGRWRVKDHWRRLELYGPRHYVSNTARQLPGVPRTAQETAPGVWEGELWDSLASTLTDGLGGVVRIRRREWRPKPVDHRRPWDGVTAGPAQPIRLGPEDQEGPARVRDDSDIRECGAVKLRRPRHD